MVGSAYRDLQNERADLRTQPFNENFAGPAARLYHATGGVVAESEAPSAASLGGHALGILEDAESHPAVDVARVLAQVHALEPAAEIRRSDVAENLFSSYFLAHRLVNLKFGL